MPESSDRFAVLEPAHSAVVEACAGSGKTWLLASRVVRLLLAGAAPGEILAITFTRKAAREIEERVVGWLRLLATGSDDVVAGFLRERGAPDDEATRRTVRGLYEKVLVAQPPLAVNTFHGWFLQLVAAAPLSANLAGATLVDADSRQFDEHWRSFAADCQRTPAGATTESLVRLLAEPGLEATRQLVSKAFDRRSDWLAYAGDEEAATAVIAALKAQLGAGEPGEALAAFCAVDWQDDAQSLLGLLEMSTLKGDGESAVSLRLALAGDDPEECFGHLCAALLNKDGSLPSRKPGPTLDKRYGVAGAARFLDLQARLGGRLAACREARLAENILAFNRDAATVFGAFLQHVDGRKRARRQIDLVDAEWNVLRLLRDERTAAFVQARLDARYRHLLLDEFQDTNPLQWQILLAWLDAYSDDVRPTVFLVGDPKQSIYRFRRAEPRLFAAAADYFAARYGALRSPKDATYRNAPAIVEVINAIFSGLPEFADFRPQSSLAGELPGRVELMPLCVAAVSGSTEPEAGDRLRDPLREPASAEEDRRLAEEAAQLAAKIREMVGAWRIDVPGIGGARSQRPARYDDILLLVRSRRNLALYEKALAAAGIPYVGGSRGGLLQTLEVRDLVALLRLLVTPEADLALAHALRSPIFACTDGDLMALAARGERGWLRRLGALAGSEAATPPLRRAARLLEGWRRLADRLPAHDLLDHIFAEGEVVDRYRRSVPAAAAGAVEANLRALLQLALEIDGGRYPSLARFVDELEDLRDVEGDEAPDEGMIAADDLEAGRVRILTVHGAKGLEAPIVWLLGANAAPRRGDAWDVLVDWPPEAPAPVHYSFTGRKDARGAARAPAFAAEAAAARREELNLLYVAVTRAQQVFIASGIEGSRAAGDTPYRRIAEALARLGSGMAHGVDLPPVARAAGAAVAPPPVDRAPWPAIGERRPEPAAAERFGILLHALLERRTGAGETEAWWRRLGFTDAEYRRARPVAERILGAGGLRRFFDPAAYRRAWNEVDVACAGELRRIDRLVEFADETWVLDYKSSGADSARLADYRAQVEAYCAALATGLAGRRLRGALIFADGSLLEVC